MVTPATGTVNPLTHNDHYSGRTAPLTSKRCTLYIYSTNVGTEYFKHGIYYSFFSSSKCSLFHNSNVFGSCIIHILNIVYSLRFSPLQNAVCCTILTYLVPVLFTFYIQDVLKLKKIIPSPKVLNALIGQTDPQFYCRFAALEFLD